MWAVPLLFPLISSSSDLLTCPPVASLTFDLSTRVLNLDGVDHGLDEAAVELLRNPFIVLSGREVAVVLREVALRSYHLLGVYYCGQYRVVPSAPAVDFSHTATNSASDSIELSQAMLRDLVAAHTTDDLLAQFMTPSADVATLLAFSVTRERRTAIDRHLRNRPRAHFESRFDIVCGESKFHAAYSWVQILGQPWNSAAPTVAQLNSFDIVGLCFVLPEVLNRVPSRDMVLRRDQGASVFEEDEDDITLQCPGPYGKRKPVSSTHDTPRGLQLKEAVRADLQRAAFDRKTDLPSISFAAFCADSDGVPSWISGRAPGVNRVQTVADRDWARLVVQTLPGLPPVSAPSNSAALQWLLKPATATMPVAPVTTAAAGGQRQCVLVEALQFQSAWSLLNPDMMYKSEADAMGGRVFSLMVAGVDVGLLFQTEAFGRNARLVGVWYCGRFFEASDKENRFTLDLPDFVERGALVMKRQLRETLVRLVAEIVTETHDDVRVQNYLSYKKVSSPAFAGDAVKKQVSPRQIQRPRVMCNDSFTANADDVFLAKRLKASDVDLHAFCALIADMVFLRRPRHPDVDTIRSSVNAASVAAVPAPGGGRVTYRVTCPNASLVPEAAPRMAQISVIIANNRPVYFVHMCQDEFGLPSWLSPGSRGPALSRYARTNLETDAELVESPNA